MAAARKWCFKIFDKTTSICISNERACLVKHSSLRKTLKSKTAAATEWLFTHFVMTTTIMV